LALVEEPLAAVADPGTAGTGDDGVLIALDLPEAVRVRTRGSGGMLVLADSFAEGWVATVDGTPVQIFKVDGLWRGVQLAPGNHDVWFRYRTPGLLRGALVSALALLLACLMALLPQCRRVPSQEPAAAPP
jgi:hypothetical protein